MSRALDRQFDAMLPAELAAVIKEAGYGFDGIPAAWAGVMGSCRPEMLAEVTAPVLLLNGQLDQLRVDARRFARAARSARWVRVVTVRRGLHVFPLTHPNETAAALWELSARRGGTGGTVTAPPTGSTCGGGVGSVRGAPRGTADRGRSSSPAGRSASPTGCRVP